jgi:hypothetical protein
LNVSETGGWEIIANATNSKTMNKKVMYFIAIGILLIANFGFSYANAAGSPSKFKEFLECIPLVVSVIAVMSARRKRTKLRSKKSFRLTSTFESGVYGGLIGGLIAGICISITFYFDSRNSNPYYSEHLDLLTYESLKIIPYGAILGALFGGFIQIGISLFNMAMPQSPWVGFLGSLVGCIVAGTLLGALGMWMFGDNRAPFVGYKLIVFGSVISAISLILGALVFEYNGQKRYVFFSMVIAIVITSFAVMIGAIILSSSPIDEFLKSKLYSREMIDLVVGGLFLGCINGAVFGLVIGLTITLYKYWRFAEKQQERFDTFANSGN